MGTQKTWPTDALPINYPHREDTIAHNIKTLKHTHTHTSNA